MTIYASDILESVKATVLVPGSQVTTPNAQILKFADDKIQSTIVPMIKGVLSRLVEENGGAKVTVSCEEEPEISSRRLTRVTVKLGWE